MALEVGTLNARIQIDTDGVSSTLSNVKRDLADVKKSADKVENLDIKTKADTSGATKAKRATDNLASAADKAASASSKIKFPKDFTPDAERAKKSVDRVGDGLAGAAAKFTKFTAATAGTAVVGGVAASLHKGFQRLDSIDQATAKLEALGNSGNDVQNIMDNALASVKGTSFGLGEAATVSANMVASGIAPGKELETVLGTVADTAAIAGTSMEDMGLIFGSVAARGKLQGDDMMQMLGRGIPVLQIVGEHLGKTSAEVSAMASDGEIDFQTFADAMESYVGGGAKRMGDTVSGALKNLGAAFGRVGAEAAKGAFSEAPGVIKELTDQVDGLGAVVGPMAAEWSARLTPAISEAATAIIPQATAALGVLSDGVEVSLPLLQGLASAITSIPTPVLAAGLLTLTARNKGWTSALDNSTSALKNWVGHARSAEGFGGKMATAFRNASGPMMVLGRETRVSARELSGMSRVAGTAMGGMQSFGGAVKGVASGAMSGFKSGVNGIIGMLGGPWGLAIMGATTVLGILIDKHMEAKQAEQEHEQAQRDLRASLDETTGAITDQTQELINKRLEESGATDAARELGMAQDTVRDAVNGNVDAMREVKVATEGAVDSALTGSKQWEALSSTFEDSGLTIDDVTQALVGNKDAMDKINSSDAMLQPGVAQAWEALKNEMEDTTGAAMTLGKEVGTLNSDLESAKAKELQNKLNGLETQSEKTSKVLSAVGDSITAIPDEKTIHVESMAPEVRKEMDKLRIEINDLPNGQVEVKFPEGHNITQIITDLGAQIKALPDGRFSVDDNTPEVQQRLIDLGVAAKDPVTGEVRIKDNISEVIGKQIELGGAVKTEEGYVYMKDNTGEVLASLNGLGIAANSLPPGEVRILDNTPEVRDALAAVGIEATELPDGHLAISDNSPEKLANLQALGIQTESLPPGTIEITDTSQENMERLDKLRIRTTTLPDGRVIVTDNAEETRRHIQTTLSKENTNTFSNHEISIVRYIKDIFERANGGIDKPVETYASGGHRDKNVDRAVARRANSNHEPSHQAQIAPAGAYRVWAEAETGGEAYIPMAPSKRGRSERILNEVARQFGYNLVDGETGMVQTFADGAVLPAAAIKARLAYMNGTPYIFGGWSRAGVDCSGAVSLVVNAAEGLDEWVERTATAGQDGFMRKRGYKQGRGRSGDIRVGVVNGGPGGGHTALQLDDGTYIESGGNTGGGFTIGGKAGPLEGRGFTDWYYKRGGMGLTTEGLDSLDSLNGVVGMPGYSTVTDAMRGMVTSTYSPDGGESESRELNGGAGTLIEDGSFLELMAALYSKKTGTPMADDVVSWGTVVGLYSKESEKSQKKNAKDAEKTAAKLEKIQDQLDKANEDLPLAEEDLRIKKMKRDEVYGKTNKKGEKTATDSQKAAADQSVAKAEKKVADTKAKIAKLEQEQKELEAEMQRLQSGADGLDVYGDLLTTTKGVGGTSGNKYADAIIKEGRRRGITDTGIKIALATALVESGMKMYANPADPASMQMPHDAVGYDHDSVGLFQQRNNGAWGTTADRMDPAKSAGMFYDQLVKADYNTGDPGAHAQRVQVSAFPGRYAQRMDEAQGFLDKYNSTKNAKITAMADGGILGGLRQAQINEGDSAVLWAEAGPEAYIPLSSDKRAQSLDIWAETGKRLGVDVMSMVNFIASGLPGLVEGRLDFSTGGSLSAAELGLNTEAAQYRTRRHAQATAQNAVGAVFNGPVQINDPKKYLQGQVDNAQKQLGMAMRSVLL
ncbi:tape measure domain-containing protein [Corynebacterium sp. HMSC070E08]|uniref:tape measure protein n=1 Tax=Corynebacterium sp. HMSC070E08 TaxID=1715006 RepID=UPI0008A65A0D|nr:tape measure protein [Corynebacterium sp. HMSC070E08]OFN80040.1 tape measure domain-containing protein [Corynebacterium sp. HMSC070E08]